MEEKNVKLSPPWYTFYHKINAMFGRDPEITIKFDEDTMILKLFVDNQAKADALAKVLPTEKDFGNVKLNIEVIPSDKVDSVKQLYKTIFSDNPVFSQVIEVTDPSMPQASYVVFNPLIVQFYNDNLADAYRNETTLLQEIAKDIFIQQSGIYYCTENIKK